MYVLLPSSDDNIVKESINTCLKWGKIFVDIWYYDLHSKRVEECFEYQKEWVWLGILKF